MYQPPHHREDRLDRKHHVIEANPLGLLVTMGKAGLSANPVPFVLDRTESPHGTLKAHLSRANPQWQDFDPAIEALIVFQGVDSYITPSWYATKQETGKVVPTWNYVTVHAYGALRVIDDPAWIAAQIDALTTLREHHRVKPWQVGDAPESFIKAQIKGIIGIEIPISRLEGKWKVSQNRSDADRSTVADGLDSEGDDRSRAMAALVRAKGG